MPYEAKRDEQACPTSKPWAVRKKGETGKPLGCHATETEANTQIAALNAKENAPMNAAIRKGAGRSS